MPWVLLFSVLNHRRCLKLTSLSLTSEKGKTSGKKKGRKNTNTTVPQWTGKDDESSLLFEVIRKGKVAESYQVPRAGMYSTPFSEEGKRKEEVTRK